MDSKVCSRCCIDKPLHEFYARADGIMGVRASCKQCDISQQELKGGWYLKGKDSRYRATTEEEWNYPSDLMDSQQDFIYERY